MTTRMVVTCDRCQKEIGGETFTVAVCRSKKPGAPQDGDTVRGDFCSLACISSWATIAALGDVDA